MAYMKSSDKLLNNNTNPTELPGQSTCLFFILPGHGDHINAIFRLFREGKSIEVGVSWVSGHFTNFIFFF